MTENPGMSTELSQIEVGRSQLGRLGSMIGSGGQAQVYDLPDLTLPDSGGHLVFKRYRPGLGPSRTLIQTIAIRAQLRSSDGWSKITKLDSIAAWPVRVVVSADGSVEGLILPRIPDSFFQTLLLPSGSSRTSPRDTQFLFIPADRVIRLGVPVASRQQRLEICRDFAGALAFLHDELDVVFGDINPRNILFRLIPEPSIMLVDCDAVRRRGSMATVPQLNAPDWDPPEGSQVLSKSTDCYKLGLFILRCLTPGLFSSVNRDPTRANTTLGNIGLGMLETALIGPPTQRPSADDRLLNRQKNNEERCVELEARVAASAQEIAAAEERRSALAQECDANRQTLASADADVAAAQEQARIRQDEARAAAANLSEVERQQEQRRVTVMQAVAEESAVRSEIAKATEQIAGYDRESSRLAAELAAANAQVEAFGAQRGQIAFQFESSSGQVTTLQTMIDATRQSLSEKRSAEAESKHRLDGLRAEFATALGKRASLESVIAEHGYSTDSVRRLFQSGAMNAGSTPAGVLADFLEVEDRYEHVVDDFLRDELNYVVVKSWDAAENGLQLLRSDVEGRATFLVHPEDSQAKFSFVPGEAVTSESMRRDAVLPLKQCIRVLDGFGKSLEVILPKLRDGYIVEDPEIARDLALENPDAFFLAATGECFHNATVTGGKPASEGPLALKRELREAESRLAKLETSLAQAETEAAVLTRTIEELTAQLESAAASGASPRPTQPTWARR